MPLSSSAFPIATDYDPAEDPPGSIDPLGTLSCAERLAEVLLPGFTARMYRLRLLTMATVAAAVAERVADGTEDSVDSFLEARLGVERLIAAALVRRRTLGVDPVSATRRLPGSLLAQKALAAREPLTTTNFLRGQAVNGASGVVMRLARNLGLLDELGGVTPSGRELLLVWADEQGLAGILDEAGGSQRAGAQWMRDVAKATSSHVKSAGWPGPGQNIWDRLVEPLRLDGAKHRERDLLRKLLHSGSPVRARILMILREAPTLRAFHGGLADGRGVAERAALVAGVRPTLGDEPADRVIGVAVDAIERYELSAVQLQLVFDSVCWVLKQRAGRASGEAVLSDQRVIAAVRAATSKLRKWLPDLRASAVALASEPGIHDVEMHEALRSFVDDAGHAAESPQHAVETVLSRHERVQKQKQKGAWIDRDGALWTLMPGRGIDGEPPLSGGDWYLHPFRVENAYAFLTDLGDVRVQVAHGETE